MPVVVAIVRRRSSAGARHPRRARLIVLPLRPRGTAGAGRTGTAARCRGARRRDGPRQDAGDEAHDLPGRRSPAARSTHLHGVPGLKPPHHPHPGRVFAPQSAAQPSVGLRLLRRGADGGRQVRRVRAKLGEHAARMETVRSVGIDSKGSVDERSVHPTRGPAGYPGFRATIKAVATGRRGSRDLTFEEAREATARCSTARSAGAGGAFLIGLRVKARRPSELGGVAQALRECVRAAVTRRPPRRCASAGRSTAPPTAGR